MDVEARKREIEQQVKELAEHKQQMKEAEARGDPADPKAQQELADRQKEVKTSLKDVTPHLDVSSNGKEAGLWNGEHADAKGVKKSNFEEAQQWQKEDPSNRVTLETTKDGKWLNELGSKDGKNLEGANIDRVLDKQDTREVWSGVSQKYAKGIEGSPACFAPEKPWDKSIMVTKELPEVKDPNLNCYHHGRNGPCEVKDRDKFLENAQGKTSDKAAETAAPEAGKQPPAASATQSAEGPAADNHAAKDGQHGASHGGQMSTDQRRETKDKLAEGSGRNGEEADKNKQPDRQNSEKDASKPKGPERSH